MSNSMVILFLFYIFTIICLLEFITYQKLIERGNMVVLCSLLNYFYKTFINLNYSDITNARDTRSPMIEILVKTVALATMPISSPHHYRTNLTFYNLTQLNFLVQFAVQIYILLFLFQTFFIVIPHSVALQNKQKLIFLANFCFLKPGIPHRSTMRVWFIL